MKEVLEFIEQKKQEFAHLPFFQYMQDKSISPLQRMAWVPCATPLVMGFADMNKYVFRRNNSEDKIQQLINKHTYEDDYHWEWFLQDVENLGFDKWQKFSDSLKFLWGKDTIKTRLLWQKIALNLYQADSIVILAAIKAEEATWDIVSSITVDITNDIEKMTNQKYYYFGKTHLEAESNHVIDTDETQKFLERIELTEEQKQKSINVVEITFNLFTEVINDFMVYAQQYPIDNERQLKVVQEYHTEFGEQKKAA